jgi:hypothetical protein
VRYPHVLSDWGYGYGSMAMVAKLHVGSPGVNRMHRHGPFLFYTAIEGILDNEIAGGGVRNDRLGCVNQPKVEEKNCRRRGQ